MWYVGILPSQQATAIGYAVSYDGVGWIHYPRPVIDAAIGSPHVIFDRGEYKMWFEGDGSSIGHATSLDGIAWATWGESLAAPAESPAVLRDGDTLKMWYADGAGIGYATFP
jgi:hypothetical protein